MMGSRRSRQRPDKREIAAALQRTDVLPADVARCRGRTWTDDEWMAPECQECKRWIAHYCDAHTSPDGIVSHIEPPTDPVCPLRIAADEAAQEIEASDE